MAAIHKRFDSESESEADFQSPLQELVPELPTEAAANEAPEDSEGSDNEAPEAVSTSAALESSRSAAQKLLEIRRQVDEQERTKRQELDRARVKQTKSRRKAQAQEKAAAGAQGQAARTEQDTQAAGEEADTISGKAEEEIPFLPQELLDAAERDRKAAEVSRQVQLLASASAVNERKRKFDVDKVNKTKRAKDAVTRTARVRLLPKMNSTTLPPRSTSKNNIAKEAWLKNRAGRTTDGTGQRKSWKSGFLVNKG